MHRYHPPLQCFKSHSSSAELPMSVFDKTHIVIDIGISSTKLAQAKIRGNKVDDDKLFVQSVYRCEGTIL